MALAVSAACMTSSMVIVNTATAAPKVYEFEDGTMSAEDHVYTGKDRGFMRRFLNQGTDDRMTKYGSRGRIEPRNWFGDASQKELEQVSSNLDKMIDDIISGILF